MTHSFGCHAVRAQVVVGADGRFSRLRGLAGLEPVRTASPVDLLWFRLPRQETDLAPAALRDRCARRSRARLISAVPAARRWRSE